MDGRPVRTDVRIKDIVGRRYGSAVVIAPAEYEPGRGAHWICRCDCGSEWVAHGGGLRRGTIQRCSACRGKRNIKTAQNHAAKLKLAKTADFLERYPGLSLQRKNNLWHKYKLTPDDYLALYSYQGGKCAITGREFPTLWGCAVDHCHETGRVRGLLEVAQNAGLGSFENSPAQLRRAAEYLERSA